MEYSLLVNTLKEAATEMYDVRQSSHTLSPRQQWFFSPFFYNWENSLLYFDMTVKILVTVTANRSINQCMLNRITSSALKSFFFFTLNMNETLEEVREKCALQLEMYQKCVENYPHSWDKSCKQQKNALNKCSEEK